MRCLLITTALLAGCVTGKYEQMDTLQFDQLSKPGPMGQATLGGQTMAYYQAGLGEPVLFLHGLGEHAGYWNLNLAPVLATERQVIVPDLMGHGRSAKQPGDHYRMTAQAQRLVALLEHLKVEQPVTVVGHSMGGQIALTLALAYPDRVKALVLLAPAGVETFTKGEARWLKQVSTVAAFKARDERQLREHYKKNVFGKWTEAADHHLEERVRVKRAAGFDGYLHAVVASIHGMLDEPVADRLATLRQPVTVVFGAADGLIPNPILHGDDPESVADKAKRLLPRAKVVVLPEVGHMLQVEAPEAVNALLEEALAAGEATP